MACLELGWVLSGLAAGLGVAALGTSIAVARGTCALAALALLAAAMIVVRRESANIQREAAALLTRARALEEANQKKSSALASMSHELRTPLNAVIGFSDLLREHVPGELNAQQTRYVEDIHRSARHLLALINDALDLSKLEAGQMKLRLERVELDRPVREAVEMIEPLALRRKVSVELVADPGVVCFADHRRVRQVALNLLSNALKFTPEGGQITAQVRRGADGRSTELLVRDTGIGIDPTDQEAIFDEFRQVGDPAHEHEGTGLGLALVRRFLVQMDGTIEVESRLGQGALFTARLPSAPPGEEARRHVSRPPLPQTQPQEGP